MKTVKIKTIQKQIKDGKVECITDLKLGFVEIRKFPSGNRGIVEIVK